ncbi:hypothetical protein GCM10023185_13440 [Hymenobacter saemangeumensis]|uniref:Peptidase S24/S26A/S26B/S26C domain-containing protein n=1 Tax=Hymenobacter saemangeumensis TaxID=1084522 RepID=A0ABP8I7Y3_9BACT
MKDTISHRIKELIADSGLNVSAFARKIDVKYQTLYSIIGPRGSLPSAGTLHSIFSAFPTVRMEWLLNGNGPKYFPPDISNSILEAHYKSQVEDEAATYDSSNHREKEDAIPFVPAAAEGSYLNGFGDEEYIEHLPKFYLPFLGLPANVYAFQVRGDSMADRFNNGDVVFGQKVEKNDALRWGEVYVLLCNDGLVVKELRRGPSEEFFTLRSFNEHFDPYEILRSEVRAMFRYQASINFNSSNPNRAGVMRFIAQLTEQMAALNNSIANLPQLK